MFAGAAYLVVKVPAFEHLFISGGGADIALSFFHEPTNNFTFLICLWFGMVNVFDIVVGHFFYPKYLGLLTGYVHHIVFIWTMLASTTGNGLFMTTRPFATPFVFMLIEEFPTFLLALGSMFPRLRTDAGFGLSFFLLRIVYHSYFACYAFLNSHVVDGAILVLYAMTLAMHLNWFYSWVTKYGKSFLGKIEKSGKHMY
jgi:hypothetical protein